MPIEEKKVYLYPGCSPNKPAETPQEALDAVIKQNRLAAVTAAWPDLEDAHFIVAEFAKISAVIQQADEKTISENKAFITQHDVDFPA